MIKPAFACVACICWVLISGPIAHAQEPGHGHSTTVGNMEAYPDLERAGERNVRRARRLHRASRRNARRFDTLAEARKLGYRVRRMWRPGFVHARLNGPTFSGRTLDPAAPQALVYWCPRRGPCTLTTYMFRARPGAAPATWHQLLQWHRHGPGGTWMTHLWLLPDLRSAFATCAPWAELERIYDLRQRRYRADLATEPCPTEPGSEPMPDMPEH